MNVMVPGNLTRDPKEISYTASGKATTSFDVAESRVWKNSAGETQKETNFFPVSVFGPLAEACAKFLKKGRQVFVVGSLRVNTTPSNKFKDDQGNPATMKFIQVIAQQVIFGAIPQPRPGGDAPTIDDLNETTAFDPDDDLAGNEPVHPSDE